MRKGSLNSLGRPHSHAWPAPPGIDRQLGSGSMERGGKTEQRHAYSLRRMTREMFEQGVGWCQHVVGASSSGFKGESAFFFLHPPTLPTCHPFLPVYRGCQSCTGEEMLSVCPDMGCSAASTLRVKPHTLLT